MRYRLLSLLFGLVYGGGIIGACWALDQDSWLLLYLFCGLSLLALWPALGFANRALDEDEKRKQEQ